MIGIDHQITSHIITLWLSRAGRCHTTTVRILPSIEGSTQECTSKGIRPQGVVLKLRKSLQKRAYALSSYAPTCAALKYTAVCCKTGRQLAFDHRLQAGRPARRITANLRTKTLNFGGFDSSRILMLRRGILMFIGIFLESLSQQILVGRILVGRLGVTRCWIWVALTPGPRLPQVGSVSLEPTEFIKEHFQGNQGGPKEGV